MENDRNSIQSYALALLALVGSQGNAQQNPLFGHAMHLETADGIYQQTAHRLLHALIQHSPAPEAVAGQFFSELAKCENINVVTLGDVFSTLYDILSIEYWAQVNSLNGDRSVSPDEWAADVYSKLSEDGGNLTHVTEFASDYLNNLVVVCRVQWNICWP